MELCGKQSKISIYFFPLTGVGSWWQQIYWCILPSNVSSSWGSQGVFRPDRLFKASIEFWVCLDSWTCLENLHRLEPRRHPEPPQVVSYDTNSKLLTTSLRLRQQP